jgi:hypothetical protein
MNPALHANFRGTPSPRLCSTAADLLESEIVWFAAKRSGRFAFRERAKTAFIFADVRIIDIAVDNISHYVAAYFVPEAISGARDFHYLAIARAK